MGVFDFLYKSKPKPQVIPRNIRQSANSSHFKQRTVTHVNRSNSLPDAPEELPSRTNGQTQPYHRQKSTNRSYHYPREQNKSSQKQNNRKVPDIDVIDYYNQSKQNANNDDFTRLSRLEVKIDNYITRHKEIADELQNIELNLGLILKEFTDEFQDDILAKGNKHVIEIGQRILAKLESFKDVPQINRHNDNNQQQQQQYSSKAREPDKKHHDSKQYVDKVKQMEVKVNGNQRHGSTPPPLPVSPPPPPDLVNSKPLAHSTFAENGHHQSYQSYQSSPLNGHFPPETGTIAKAKYMVVEDSYSTDISPIAHYKSASALAKPGQAYQNNQQQQRYALDDTYNDRRNFLPDTGSTRLYLNMSMTMHSDHPVIEHCFRRIELLRPRIMHYKSEHKLRVYKDLDGEIIHLMNKLEALECHEPIFQQDKNVALCELHNLAGILERSIECHDPECIICNSFIYKPEVSV